MIKETFNALKDIGVKDEHILNVVAALEDRHEEYRKNIAAIREDMQGMRNETRDEMRAMKADITILKWSMAVWPTLFFGLVVAILLKLFS